ncbi:hypothetical protein SynROS8604_03714 [Synechococcus sp. ROS8604]|nr:hypothetical protein SynROS8604_03714 [Synechococcus sp. ROS8604]
MGWPILIEHWLTIALSHQRSACLLGHVLFVTDRLIATTNGSKDGFLVSVNTFSGLMQQ